MSLRVLLWSLKIRIWTLYIAFSITNAETNQAIVKKTVLLNEMEDIAALPNKPTMCMTSLTGIWF